MRNENLSISPTRRKTGSAYYEFPIYSANSMQTRAAVKPFEKRYHRSHFGAFVAWAIFVTVLAAGIYFFG